MNRGHAIISEPNVAIAVHCDIITGTEPVPKVVVE